MGVFSGKKPSVSAETRTLKDASGLELPELRSFMPEEKMQAHAERLEPLFQKIEALDSLEKKSQITTVDMIEILALWNQALNEYLHSDDVRLPTFFIQQINQKLSNLGQNKLEGINEVKRNAVYVCLQSSLRKFSSGLSESETSEILNAINRALNLLERTHIDSDSAEVIRKTKANPTPSDSKDFMDIIQEEHIHRLVSIFPVDFSAELFDEFPNQTAYLSQLSDDSIEFVVGLGEARLEDVVANSVELYDRFFTEFNPDPDKAATDGQGSIRCESFLELVNYWLKFNLTFGKELKTLENRFDERPQASLAERDYLQIANATFLFSVLTDSAIETRIPRVSRKQREMLSKFANSTFYNFSPFQEVFRSLFVSFHNILKGTKLSFRQNPNMHFPGSREGGLARSRRQSSS